MSEIVDMHEPPQRLGALRTEGWMRTPPASKEQCWELQTTAANTCQHIISLDKEVSFPHNVSEVVGMHEPPQRLGASITEGWIRAPSTYWIERTFMAIARTIETASLGKLG